jgi:4-amino-4-deoxy-L-arabinose transferase-like glycosyltransferase
VTATGSAPDHLPGKTRFGGGVALVAQLRSLASAPAAVAIGIAALFLLLTFWWLARNLAMPYGDASFHLHTALQFHDEMSDGHWGVPFTWHIDVYPPLTPFVGALGMFVAGRTISAPIVVENLVYVPLLAIACYRIGRRAYGPFAGCLAVAFALGAPLIAEQFHVFMLDAPLTALVAGTVWLVIESERFERPLIAAAAGALAGFGILSKQTFPLYVTGFVILVLARNGAWRNRAGLAAFLVPMLLIAAPWYVDHAAQLHHTLVDAGREDNVPPLAKPTMFSTENFMWYFWALSNGLLFMPLLGFAAVGVVTAGIGVVRDRWRRTLTGELLGGLVLAFCAITVMPHKDVRYSMPLTIFLAVLGTGWIARLRRTSRAIASSVLALAVVASTMGATFGIGPRHDGMLPGNWSAPRGQGVMPLNTFTVYANHNYMVSGPRRAGDLLGLFEELRKRGVREVLLPDAEAPLSDADFNLGGVILFVHLAHLSFAEDVRSRVFDPTLAMVIHARAFGRAPPCVHLPDGDGLWIRLGYAPAPGARHDFCPRFRQRLYGP